MIQIPGWLSNKAILVAVSGVSAALGWAGKEVFAYLKNRNKSRTQRFEKLEELRSLLQESRSLFVSQNEQARRLMKLIKVNHPGEIDEELGFDDTFYSVFLKFTQEERELHALVRGLTKNAIRRVNERMSDWLRQNAAFKIASGNDDLLSELGRELVKLELHLHEWHNKYDVLFADDTTGRRSLVYLDDEKKQGHSFPSELEPVLAKVLDRR